MSPTPLYTIESCRAAHQLNWSLTLFWRREPPNEQEWLEPLRTATEVDDVRIVEHRFTNRGNSQFLISTKPTVSPSATIRSIKGRLQHRVRTILPKAFQRNYSIQSVGSGNTTAIENYVAKQTGHHRMADAAVQKRLERYQIVDTAIDLSQMRRSSYGLFLHNLHLVMVHRDRDVEVCEESLQRSIDTMRKICRKKGRLLSRAGLVADHMHLTLGCGVNEAPGDVALNTMNNLTFAHGMKGLFEDSYYVGTFGPYDLNAIRRGL